MATAAERDKRRQRALALRTEGLSARQVAARLGVSHPTVLRDLAAPARPPLPAITPYMKQRIATGHGAAGQDARRQQVRKLRQAGAGVREIARLIGMSPATVSADLRYLRRWELRHTAGVLRVVEPDDNRRVVLAVREDYGR